MQKLMQDTRGRISGLHLLAHQTEQAERKILQSAQERLKAVVAEIAKTAPDVNSDPAAGDRYQRLVLERGQLETVIGRARRALAE